MKGDIYTVAPAADGSYLLPLCDRAVPRPCSLCGAVAVLPLDIPTLALQRDDTTHVCHPVLRGCNHGFTITEGE